MKRIQLLLAALCCLSLAGYSQVQATQQGNVLVQTPVVKTEAEVIGAAEKTTMTFKTMTGDTYPVYKAANGKLFYVRQSKDTGGYYKQNITVK